MTIIADDALMETPTVTCADCGGSTYDPVTTASGSTICSDCADDSSYVECSHCLRLTDDYESVDGSNVCQPCLDASPDYIFCSECEQWATTEGSSLAYDQDRVCRSCYQNQYRWCDACGYAVGAEDENHIHNDDDDGCACVAPHPSFQIRNDGEPMLDNDTLAVVSLPSGVISDEGLYAIGQALRRVRDENDHYGNEAYVSRVRVSYGVDALDPRWQTREGNFTKRLSRYAYKNHGVKLSPDLVSEIGNLARAHSTGQDYHLEFTRQLNLPPEDFYNEDSCWWQSYSESRCAFKANGGIGLRTFDPDTDYPVVSGRAWVMPLTGDGTHLTVTHDTETPVAFVVFNGYGNLTGYTPARIMAHMAGMTYRKVDLYARPMYVNGEAGYLVAPEDIATLYTDGTLTLTLNPYS